jgi:AmmeMemoRadiSam system protein B
MRFDEPNGITKALVLPHAGLIYSGPVAGTGYKLLEKDRDAVRRIILLGPSHRVAFDGLALSEAAAFTTPLGEIPIDEEGTAAALLVPGVCRMEAAHAREHSLEMQLPFLQTVLGHFTLVPMVVGETNETQLNAVLEKLWGGPETRIIVSSDLSHFHNYRTARQLDQKTAAQVEALESVTPEQACGANPLNGLLRAARNHKLTARTLDLRNSGDTTGNRSRVVGYGAFAFLED